MGEDDPLFDPERREPAWRPLAAELEARVPDRFAGIQPVRPTGEQAKELLRELELRLLRRFPENVEAFSSFLDELRQLTAQAWPLPSEGALLPSEEEVEAPLEDDAPPSPPEAARTLVTELERLEDLIEAIALAARFR